MNILTLNLAMYLFGYNIFDNTCIKADVTYFNFYYLYTLINILYTTIVHNDNINVIFWRESRGV